MSTKKLTMDHMHALAELKEGECLSTKYSGNKVKLKWRCKKKHIFKMIPNAVTSGQWCPKCSGKYRYTTEDVKQIIKSKGGKFLSIKYVNCRSKILIDCGNGHEWLSSLEKLNQGHWCPHCYGNARLTIIDMQETANKKNGKCLSTEYHGVETKLHWECEELHRWWSTPHSVRAGRWCHECGELLRIKKRRKYKIEYIKNFAIGKKGMCLSDEYINDKELLKWKCLKNHQWNASWASVYRNGTWCSYCSLYKTENQCRKIFEDLTGYKFPKYRSDKIRNPKTNRKLELDGYCKELKTAFEYNGYQHYEYPNGFHKQKDQFLKQQSNDKVKIKSCNKIGIKLIIIPYTVKDLESFIEKKLKGVIV